MRLTKNNYQDDLFELQATKKIKVDEHTTIKYSQANYNDDLWNKAKNVEDLEEELGLPLKIYIYLTQKYLKKQRIYIENIYDNEKEKELTKQVNGRKQRYIVNIDFVKKRVFIQGSEKWTCVKFEDYGKIWALTREELELI